MDYTQRNEVDMEIDRAAALVDIKAGNLTSVNWAEFLNKCFDMPDTTDQWDWFWSWAEENNIGYAMDNSSGIIEFSPH